MLDVVIKQKDILYLSSNGLTTYTFWVLKNGGVLVSHNEVLYFKIETVKSKQTDTDVDCNVAVPEFIATYVEGVGTEVLWSGSVEVENIGVGVVSYRDGKVVYERSK